MKRYDIYVGGVFQTTDQVLEVMNPYSGEIVGQTYLAGTTELENAINAAQAAQRQMANLPAYKKYDILLFIAGKIKEQRNELALILSQEAAKPLKYALSEIDRAAQCFVIAAEETKRLPAEYLSIDWTAAGTGKEAIVNYFPLGLIAGIAPFNFPLNLAVHKIAPALATGNCIILKPARSTPLSVLALAKIIDQTDLPKGAFSVLPMDRIAGNLLVTDTRFKMLSFTGSPEVGWEMKNQAGKKKVVLELGGNAGVIVTQSADIDLAVQKCLVGSFAYSGQVCIHVQRMFVHEDIFNEFTEKFIVETKKLVTGAPEMPETDISAMIDEANAERVESWVNEAKANGAKILTGGTRNGSNFEPTVLTNVTSEMKICRMEVFGPVVTLEPYNDFKLAVEAVNDSEYGLQAGVFTDKLSEMNFAFANLEVGGVIINDVPTFRVDHMPYGGVKNSGFGREGIKYAMHEMLEAKLLVKNKF